MKVRLRADVLCMLFVALCGSTATATLAHVLGTVRGVSYSELHLLTPLACYLHFFIGVFMGFVFVGVEYYLIRRYLKGGFALFTLIIDCLLALISGLLIYFTLDFAIALTYFGMQIAFVLPYYWRRPSPTNSSESGIAASHVV